jgi:predicted ATPase
VYGKRRKHRNVQRKGNGNTRTHLVVGRTAEVGYLEQCLETALTGERQVVFLSGALGIGKTTIVDAFLGRLRNWELGSSAPPPPPPPSSHIPVPEVWMGRGQCIEQYGAGEAFMPLLEIAGQLCRGPNRDQTRALLRQYAPSWLVQLPFLVDATELEALQRQLQGSTRERMLREAAEVLTIFTRQRGLVLVLEDLHWSDESTLEWLSYIAQRREPAKLLIIGTYRPTDVLVSGHSLRGVVQELTARNRCEELRVAPLSEQSVSDYLTSRLSRSLVTSPLPSLIHRRTGGNPLFMVHVVDDLLQQGLVREEAGQWTIQHNLRIVTESVPDTLRQVIERQVARLSTTGQHLLEVASVVGVEFSAAAVAAGLQATVEDIDHQCEILARQGQFIEAHGTEEWPDGTFSERYSFRHALYHDVLYQRVTETQRIRLHRRIAERKEQAYGERAGEIAAELALHFEVGRMYQKAVDYCQLAGGAAVQRQARHEAAALLTRGLQLLQGLSDSPGHLQQELEFNVTLGNVLIGTRGYAAPETERAYRQAWELCQQLGDTLQRFPVLDGLRHYYAMRGEQKMAYQVEEQLFALAQQAQDPALMMWAHGSRGVTLLWMGAFVEARTHLESRIALSESYQPRTDLPRYGNPAVMGLSHLSLVLWMLGYPDQGLQKVQQALALAQHLEDAFSIAYAQTNAGLIHQHRREGAVAQDLAESAIALSRAQGLPFWLAGGLMARGGALVEQGQTQEGIRQIEQGLQAWRATGAANSEPYFLMLLAEGYAKAGHTAEALTIVTKALTRMEQTAERCWEAELYRLKGELTLAEAQDSGLGAGSSSPQTPNLKPQVSVVVEQEAEECFLKAINIAQHQQAKSLELRASLSLARLWQSQGKSAEARELLEDIYSWFTEGFATKDLQDAEALLRELGSSAAQQKSKVKSQKAKQAEGIRLKAEGSPQFSFSSLQPTALSLAQFPAPNFQSLPSNIFRHEGEYWAVTFAGTTCRIRNILGVRYLAQLLTHPHEEIHVLTLAAEEPSLASSLPTGGVQADVARASFTDAGEVLDPQARTAYRQRLRDLQEELAEAQSFNDPGRVEKLQAEIDFLTHELAQAVGLGGRGRKAASVAERARVNVTKRIKIALRKISEQHPTLGEHLTQTIRTGTFCVYAPSPHQPVRWQTSIRILPSSL